MSATQETRRRDAPPTRQGDGGRRPNRHNPARSSERPSQARAARQSETRPATARRAAPAQMQPGATSAEAAVSHLLASPHARLIAIAVIVLLIAWALLSALGSCSASARAAGPASAKFVSSSAPNWEDLHEEDGRMVYTVDGDVASLTGVDVSEHQGQIDWGAVADDGIDFAIVRVGWRGAAEGEVCEDERFAENMDGAHKAGLDVGAYFFSQAMNEEEAVEEADFVLARLRGRELSYPVVYDHEPVEGVDGRADDLSVEQMTANARAFCDRIAQAGYAAMIYGNAGDLARYSLKDLADYGIWFAEYGSTIPSRLGRFSIWQYTNEGAVAGINGAVDLNIRFPKDEG